MLAFFSENSNNNIPKRIIASVGLLFALLVTRCSSSSDSVDPPEAGNPGASAATCTQYGDPPRQVERTSVDESLNTVLDAILNICKTYNGETMTWTDNQGTPRTACMIAPSNASLQNPMPMIMWLHPTLIAQDALIATGLLDLINSANLTGDPQRPGYILLIPVARNIQQFLSPPLDVGVGWDHWYRNMDRSSPNLNPDVATFDHFIEAVKSKGIVDTKRIYVSGWSEGADMGTLYGLNTPGIAATGVYSTVSPFADPADPCPGPAFASNDTRPYYLIVRRCDTFGACQGGQEFLNQLKNGVLAPNLVSGVILNSHETPVEACDPACAQPTIAGSHEHTHWPTNWNSELLGFMRTNPEP